MFFLAILRINEIREKTIDQYSHMLEKHANDVIWLNKELYELNKKRNYAVFNKIYKAKYEILKTFLENRTVKSDIISSTQTASQSQMQEATSRVSLKESVDHYNKELYYNVWSFLDEYITKTLTPLFVKEDIAVIKQGVFEFFINDRRTIDTDHKVIIPTCLSMQDIAHFLHNISELISYYKKIKQVDFFKYLSFAS